MARDFISNLIKQDGRTRGGLGKYYLVELKNKTFIEGEKVVDKRYVAPLRNASGQFKVIQAANLQALVDKFVVEHANGWNETTASDQEMSPFLRESKGGFPETVWYMGGVSDQGNLPATAYPAPPQNQDTKIYQPGGMPGGNLDFWTTIIGFFRWLGIK
jgi:hypothetical protein